MAGDAVSGLTRAKSNNRRIESVGRQTVWGMTAVVTGGASGIGLGVAKRIAAEGGRVTIWDQDPARLKAAVAEVDATAARADEVNVADPSSVERASTLQPPRARWAISTFSSARAGVAGKNALVIDYPIDEWKRVFDINVHGLFYCNRFVAKLMKHRGYGRIVNIASIAGKEGNPTASAYSASKAAVIGLTKSLGKELAKDGVCVDTITPATIDTPILCKCRKRISTTCARKFRWSASAPSKRRPRSSAGSRAANARSRPARSSISRAAARPTKTYERSGRACTSLRPSSPAT